MTDAEVDKVLTVHVLQSGSLEKQVKFQGPKACSVIAARLRERYGPGSMKLAGSDVELLADDLLEPRQVYTYSIDPPAGAATAAAAGALLGGVAHVHIRGSDGIWSSKRVPLEDGRLELQREPGLVLQKRYHLSNERLEAEQLQRVAWQRLKRADFAVSPNSHLYLMEKPGEDLGVLGYVTRSQFVLMFIIAARAVETATGFGLGIAVLLNCCVAVVRGDAVLAALQQH